MRAIFHRIRILSALMLVIVGFSSYGCSSDPTQELDRALSAATEIELYSIDGTEDEPGELKQLERVGEFHHFPVLGQITLTDSKSITELVDAFRSGVNENDIMPEECFWPRHAIRVVYDGVTYDIVICFQCSQYEWYKDDERQGTKLIGDSPQPTFNRILEEAGVPLAEPAL